MSGNAQKTPLAQSLNRFAENKVLDALQITGKSLPASVVQVQGSIVKVKFEVSSPTFTLPNVTVPMAGSEYIRLPIQVGCLGWVMSADAYLGGMSGLGGGVADLSLRANLSALVWSPIGNKNWQAPINPNALELWGPDGVIIRSANKANQLLINDTESRFIGDLHVVGNLFIGGFLLNIDGSVYPHSIATSGEVVAKSGIIGQQVTLSGHITTGVKAGSDVSGPPEGGT